MIGLAAGTRVWIVAGVTDLRRGFVGLSGMVQTALKENPFSGQVFVFRGKRGDLEILRLCWVPRYVVLGWRGRMNTVCCESEGNIT